MTATLFKRAGPLLFPSGSPDMEQRRQDFVKMHWREERGRGEHEREGGRNVRLAG